MPNAKLAIVGSNPPAEVLALAGARISVSANVSEARLREHYRASRVAVVPLRYGAGVKLKVVEALREGLPVVTTSIGAQGLDGLAGVVSIHDDSDGIADAVCRLLGDDALWIERSTTQVEYAASHYSEAAFSVSLTAALAQVPRRCALRLAS
jgi:glycosyltransferase involved in cell wall biosynthesis